MKAESKKWLDAAILLGWDPTAKVRCPVCEHEYLTVRDVCPTPDSDDFERYLECPNCKSRNIMRMKRSSAAPTSAMPTSGTKSER
jgi:DNA-directed RNA polymerase subunit RPC12/RpoP